MTFPKPPFSKIRSSRKDRVADRSRREQSRKRRAKRHSILESLEARQLLAGGPELIGIQPNVGSLLQEGSVLNVSPRELVFRFDDNSQIDPSTLDAIRITRSGEDGVFESATETTDLGSGGSILVEFRAAQSGSIGNGITVNLTSSFRNGPRAPIVTTGERSVTIDLNSNPASPTQVQDLISAVNNDPAAREIIEVIQVSGASQVVVGTTVQDGTLTLAGANAAEAVTDFGTNGDVRVRLVSQILGADGRGTTVEVSQRNFGGQANPLVIVTGQNINVQLNSTPGFESTAADFIAAINSNPDSSSLILATAQQGDVSTVIGGQPTNFSPLTLSGVSDVVVQPGFVGLGETDREVVFRFAEPLPDDVYQLDISGTGITGLRNVDGELLQNGTDFTTTFSINLGPQVAAVVPEPVRRNPNGSLSPEIGVIEVHFNQDDLAPELAERPEFYQLIFTNDTANNLDDVIRTPVTVSYNNITNIATLDFQEPLSRMRPNGVTTGPFLTGAARLRVGTSEGVPTAPANVTLLEDPLNPIEPGDTFDGDASNRPFDLQDQWTITSDSLSSAIVSAEIFNTVPFDLNLPGPDLAGTRTIRPDDPTRLTRAIPLDFVRGGPDVIDGISVIEYDFAETFLGDDPTRAGIVNDTTYFNVISEQQKQRVREALQLFSEYLGVSFVEVEGNATSENFFSIVVGDLYGGDPNATSGQGGTAVVTADRNLDGIDDLGVLDFQDFDESNDDSFGEEFFRGALFIVGQLLGYGYADDLPQPVTQSNDFIFQPGGDTEVAFPSVADIVHGQFLYRPDSTDIDLYEFTLDTSGALSIETIAERLGVPSLLDTNLKLYHRASSSDPFVEIAQNDDYFSNDSLVSISAQRGDYVIGVSAGGNDDYDPTIPGTGFGGLTEGAYDLRVDFRPDTTLGITDTTGVALDGDADGTPGGFFDFWFSPADPSNTLYVDKLGSSSGGAIGQAGNPFTEIDQAIAFIENSRIQQNLSEDEFTEFTIRVVGNGGADGLVETAEDNLSYQIGFSSNGTVLADGSSLEVPQDVNLVIDAGAVLKLSRARVGVGSVSPLIDVSNSSLQVLGTPTLIGANGLPARDSTNQLIPGSVFFTSLNDDSVGSGNSPAFTPAALPGDWGGLDFQGTLDASDESRRNRELEGVFLNHVQYADIRYGGGAVAVGGTQVVVSPIELAITRPTIINSRVTNSADAAIAATPDTFAETRFTDPMFQGMDPFTPDYSRVGPEIRGNTVIDNSINGLFIRLQTRTGSEVETISQTTRFDDTDIPHVLTENLVIEGTPGGPVIQSSAPSALLIRPTPTATGNVPAGTYVYRITNVNSTGLESAVSLPTIPVTLDAPGGVLLSGLPTVSAGTDFVSRRLYRATVDPVTNEPLTFELVAQLNASSTTFEDRAENGISELVTTGPVLRSRLDASLVIDPGTVIKIDGARIEARFGANLIAEGLPSLPIVFTSIEDQEYGGGGTFDTNDRGDFGELNPGDWGGIYLGHGSSGSFDNTVIAGAGGTTRIEGGFASFNALEVHQADLRLTNSTLENNADGRGEPNGSRGGRLENASSTIYVSASTPVIFGNDFVDGESSAISFDLNSLNSIEVNDPGRSTGLLDRVPIVGNTGPLIQNNSLTGNGINGLEVRGGQLTTAGVWDDVDITHVVLGTIEVPNQHIFGGLRLQSDARGSLVVKFESQEDDPAGIVVGGSLLTAENNLRDIPDRIGGALQIIGHPDFPVVLTTLSDDLVGAGFTRDGQPATDTNGDGVVATDQDTTTDGFTTLPAGPEVNLGNLIDNDVDPATPGFFAATIGDGNDIGIGDDNLTVETAAGQLLQNQSFIFSYSTYITIGTATERLADTTITQPATLIADDVVESRGTFNGPNGLVNWIAQSRFPDGSTTLFNTLELESATAGAALGDIQVVTYLDEDVGGNTDDFLATVGTPGEADFRAFTLDGPQRVGFSHGGFYSEDGVNQVNADFTGWAADQFRDLLDAIEAGTQTYSVAGDIDLVDLPAAADPDFGTTNGPNDVTTAFAWNVVAAASTSTVTSFLELLPQDPVESAINTETGLWHGVTIREGASDRNVVAVAEQEPLRTAFFGTNDIPAQSQFLGQLAPNELAGDENLRLGFIVNGAITTRDDLDVYSFRAESNTEVFIDIDRTSTQFDSVVELIDANGFTIAASNDSILAETDPANSLFSASGLNPDAVQSLSVIPERLEVQEIRIGESIVDTDGDLTLSVSTSNDNVLVPVDAFLANPAGAIETALETAFPNEAGDILVSLLRRTEREVASDGSLIRGGDDFILRVQFDDALFVGRSAPGIAISATTLDDQTVPTSVSTTLLDSQLQDDYSSNLRDAGFRIVLPGEAGTINDYHIRVRSSNTQDPTDFDTLAVQRTDNPNDASSRLRDGLTTGRYELQVRLQEQDETAGTQIRLADIRFATNGLQIIGQPFHSPLLGEEQETSGANDVLAQAQPLGNFGQAGDGDVVTRINEATIAVAQAQLDVAAAATQQEIADAQLALQNAQDELRSVRGLISPLQSDTLSTSFGGVIDSANDVDWYRFEIQYQNLTRDAANLYLSTIFDLDYASNFARADLGLYVFDATGALILVGGDSNIADDQPNSLTSNSTGNLSAGSAGTQDPFIGAAELLEGTYFVAIASQQRVPLPLDQFFNPNSANPLFRLEPLESVERIADDRIESSGIGTASPPQIDFLFDDNSIVDHSLDDVVLYVNTGGGLFAVNPFTGENLGSVGGGFGQGDTIRDVAFTRNGELFGYSLVDGGNGDTSWAYHRIDSGNGSIEANLSVGAGITTLEFSGNLVVNMMTGAVTPPVLDVVSDAGINVEAITIRAIRGQEEGFFVGSRGDLGNVPGVNLTVFGPAPGNLTFGGAFGVNGLGYGENILYEFNPQTGEAIGANPPSILVSNAGAGTTPREIGFIDTDEIGGANSQLGIGPVTTVGNNGIPVQQIFDGDTITIDDFINPAVTLEIDLGFTLTPTGTIADGDSFVVDNVVYEFNTGQSIQLEAVSPVGNLNGGSTVRVSSPSGETVGFQFLLPGQLPVGGNIGIDLIDPFGQELSPFQLSAALSAAINTNLPELLSSPIGDTVVFNGTRPTALTNTGLGINILGSEFLTDPTAVEISVGPAVSSDALVSAVSQALSLSGVPSNSSGNFISLPNAASVVVPTGSALTLLGSAPGVQGTNVPVFVLPTDTAETVALRIAAAFNGTNPGSELLPGITLTPSGTGNSLSLNGAALITQVSSQSGVINVGGDAPGGTITGVELLGNSLFAVSDTGGLWEISAGQLNGSGPSQVGNYIEQSTALRGINFTGLRAGPNSVLDGALSDILFGITGNGDIHAFNTLGELQPVFAGGRSSISTGIFGAEGLDFSTLDFNLWHETFVRGNDPGHGQNSIDSFRAGSNGSQSLAFNFEPAVHNVNFDGAERPIATGPDGTFNTADDVDRRQDNEDLAFTYNFPGGAQGAINSNPFSLQGYSPSDQPTIYFNYFIGVDNDNTDRLRVYVVDEAGVEHLVASNSVTRFIGTSDDEFDDPDPLFFPTYDDDIDVDVQQLFDNTGTWRQARVPLNEFAGLQNLSLRIEFSTSGVTSSNSTTVRAPAGNLLFEGQTLVVNGESFPIDLAPAVRVPSGLELASLYQDPAAVATIVVDGHEFVLNDGTRAVNLDQTSVDLQSVILSGSSLGNLTADQIAGAIQSTLLNSPPPSPSLPGFNFSDPEDLTPNLGRNDLIFEATPLPYSSGNLLITGSGLFGSDPANGPVSNLDDVDLLQVTLQPDTTIGVNLELATARQASIRFFDAAGDELLNTSLRIDQVTGQQFVQYQSNGTETIFIGLSDPNNQSYDPRFVNDPGLSNGIADSYNATIEINQRLNVLFEGNLVEIEGAQTLAAFPSSLFTISGTTAVSGNAIPVSRFDSASQVATETQRVIAARFGQGDITRIPTSGPSVTLPLLTVNDAGPYALESDRFGDNFDSNFQNTVNANNTNLVTTAASGNDFEGVYLDDFIIGFAERGERATGSNPVTTDFVTDGLPNFPVPADPVSNLRTGSYQVEIRDGSEFVASGTDTLFRSIDTNDRLTTGALSLVAHSADAIQDGFTFAINDGRSEIEFEFNLIESNTTITPGRVEIPYTLLFVDPDTGATRPQNESEIAQAIVDAINLDDVQSIIDAPAVKASGFDAVFDSRVNVFGDVVITDEVGAFAEVTLNASRGDENRERDAQGVILVENSRFIFNENYGVDISHDLTAVVNGVETDSLIRYPRNLIELNTDGLIPGVVVQSSVFAFNGVGGLQIAGIDSSLDETRNDPVAFDRIINNTFIGGTVTAGIQAPADTFGGILFPGGALSFADEVVDFSPDAGGSAPALTFQDAATALGAPDSTSGIEPIDGLSTVSLGLGGSLTVEFTNNLLTGSDDAQPDLVVFEVGTVESIRVEISRDGLSFFDVGVLGGLTNRLDIDAAGFSSQDRFAFVRLTDLRQGDPAIPQLGADIDAIGALSSAPVDNFTSGGIGINIVGGAAPTLLNNVISNSESGITIDATNTSAVLGGNTFYRNDENVPAGVSVGQFAQELSPSEILFVGAENFIFSPAAGASIIDSSIDSLEDRSSLAAVRNPLGIPQSPILAPTLDVNGQLRVDDPNVETPSGLGERVFSDRGAADRGDLDGPRAVLLSPRAPGLGTGAGTVSVLGEVPRFFEVQLIDGLSPADVTPGTGVDDTTISSSSVLLLRDNEPLVEGIDYRFGYNPSTNIIRITPIAGIFEADSTYIIRLIDSSDAVVTAIDGTEYDDGAVLTVLDTLGNPTAFEYETGVSLDFSSSLTGEFADGIVLEVFDGSVLVNYELDSNGLNNPSNVIIPVPALANAEQIADIVASALNANAALNFTATSSESTVQLLGGTPLSSVVTTSNFVDISGEIGTSIGFGIEIPSLGANPDTVTDGQTFTIRRGSLNSATFEFDTDGTLIDPTATAVNILATSSLDDIAGAIVRAIGGAGLGLDPINAGFGRIALGNDPNFTLDLSGSTLVQLGIPGQVATVPISIPIDATATENAQIISAAVNSQNLPGVSTSVVDARVFLEGTGGVSGVGAADLVTIADKVGNQLQSNQSNGRTELTIFVGSGFDFGDAPAPYTSLEVNNGPRHAVDPSFSLGASVTPDSNAVLVDEDDDDGVTIAGTLQSGFASNVSIFVNNTDNREFYVDAWFDWNADGVFSTDEQFRYGSAGTGRILLVPGVSNTVLVDVPAGAQVGEIYARFRLSESPNTGPLGEASSGEVEDYRLFVSNNPFQNPTEFTDVNASGFTSPVDALQVINAIDRADLVDNSIDLSNESEIPDPLPQFPDVNGDGFVTALDALLVINSLNQSFGNGEQSAEGESVSIDNLASSFVPAASGVLASSTTALGDALIEETQAAQQPVSTIDSPSPSRASIFDDPAVVTLDSVVDSIALDAAQDSAESSSQDSETDALDRLFAQL